MGTWGGGHVAAHYNAPIHECITHCSPPQLTSVPAQCTRQTNVFPALRDGMKVMRPFAKSLCTRFVFISYFLSPVTTESQRFTGGLLSSDWRNFSRVIKSFGIFVCKFVFDVVWCGIRDSIKDDKKYQKWQRVSRRWKEKIKNETRLLRRNGPYVVCYWC